MIGRIGASIGRLGLWSGASRLALGQLILDRLSPSAAIALRKMRTAYLGAAVRERRSSDNAEADIGFVGQELARNRFFSSATDWTLGANASISGSALVCAANTFTIAGQNMGLVTGRTYQITLRVNKTGSFPHARIRASTSNDPSLEGTNQTPLSAASPPNGPSVYSQKITANGPVLVIASSDAVWTGSIYSISVKDVGVVDQDIDLDVIEAMAFASGVTNLVPNPKALGAVVGNPGAPPTGWTFGAQNGLTTEIVSTGAADGVNYVDVRWSGVSTATGGIVGLFHSLNLPIGTILSGALSVGLIGGSLANVGGFQIRAGDGGAGHLLFTPSATFQRYQFTQTVAGTINARLTLRFNAQS
ncbi:MAG: hypothetical protein RLZZ157_90, partial [Pseudomonadota bacterium]